MRIWIILILNGTILQSKRINSQDIKREDKRGYKKRFLKRFLKIFFSCTQSWKVKRFIHNTHPIFEITFRAILLPILGLQGKHFSQKFSNRTSENSLSDNR